eukprot:14543253-Alexandrium_andersonii.AAC.1
MCIRDRALAAARALASVVAFEQKASRGRRWLRWALVEAPLAARMAARAAWLEAPARLLARGDGWWAPPQKLASSALSWWPFAQAGNAHPAGEGRLPDPATRSATGRRAVSLRAAARCWGWLAAAQPPAGGVLPCCALVLAATTQVAARAANWVGRFLLEGWCFFGIACWALAASGARWPVGPAARAVRIGCRRRQRRAMLVTILVVWALAGSAPGLLPVWGPLCLMATWARLHQWAAVALGSGRMRKRWRAWACGVAGCAWAWKRVVRLVGARGPPADDQSRARPRWMVRPRAPGAAASCGCA